MHPLIRDIQKNQLKNVPVIRPGYTVSVHQKIKEGAKERVQIFEGLVIAVGKGSESQKSFTVRKVVEGIGAEKVFPLHSPNIAKIVVKKESSVRRSKLYYMRSRFGKSARLREEAMGEAFFQKHAEENPETGPIHEAPKGVVSQQDPAMLSNSGPVA